MIPQGVQIFVALEPIKLAIRLIGFQDWPKSKSATTLSTAKKK